MSYNGIGLKSAKGSSTSGYIQRNSGDAKVDKIGESKGKHFYKRKLNEKYSNKVEKQRKISNLSMDKDIVSHEIKREIEVKVMEYRDQIEDDNSDIDDEKIDALVEKYRNQLVNARRKDEERKRKSAIKTDRSTFAYNKVVNPFSDKVNQNEGKAKTVAETEAGGVLRNKKETD